MSKINITLDVSKINKDKIIERRYTNKDGIEVLVKDYKIEVIPTNEVKIITSGPTWVMKKTHFVVEGQSKEEKAAKAKSNYIGEGFVFESTNGVIESNTTASNYNNITGPDMQTGTDYPTEELNAEDIPF